MRKLLSIFVITILITACSDDEISKGPVLEDSRNYPLANKYDRRIQRGSLVRGGSWIFGTKNTDQDTVGSSMGAGGVNAYMWRATLDVVSFMPLQSADAVGGVIITDWYEDENLKGERMKANILISSDDLRADALKVKLFRQTLDGSGKWRDATVNNELETKLEDKILTRARELKIEGERI
jgi:hypothetical protein